MSTNRRQLFVDVSITPGGGGVKPDGTPTPRVDFDYYLAALGETGYDSRRLVLDPQSQSRWTMQWAIQDALGYDGKKEPAEHAIQRLRDLAARLTYLPELRVHRCVVLGDHDDCRMPHPGDD